MSLLRFIRFWRYWACFRAYGWALPNTLVGLAFLPLAIGRGAGVRVVDGVIEVHSRPIAWLLGRWILVPGGVSAITFGHVVVGRDEARLAGSRAHERVHVRQYERWGPLFLPAYLLSSLAAWLRGRDPYRDNRFERQARERTARTEMNPGFSVNLRAEALMNDAGQSSGLNSRATRSPAR